MARMTNYTQPSVQAPDTTGGRPMVPTTAPVRMTVLYHLTLLDLYLLSPMDTADVDTGFVLGSMNGVSSPFGQGVHGGSYLMPGTHVLVLKSTTTGYADVGGKHTAIHPIVSVDNELPASDTWFWPVWGMPPGEWKLDTSSVDKAIEAYHNIPETDRLKGKPDDRTPGDWEVGNALKGHFYVGGTRLGMEASPVASLHMYSDDSTVVFNKGFNFISDTPWGRTGDTLDDTGSSVEAEHRADNVAGAFGQESADKLLSPSGDVASVQKETKITVNEGSPRWDWLNYRGKGVGGTVSQRILHRTDANDPQPGLFDFEGVDGTSMKGAAGSLTLSRTPDLPYLEMLNEIGTPGHESETPKDSDDNSVLPVEMGDYATQYADLMYELMKRRFVERYWKGKKANEKDWKALSAEDVAKLMGRDIEKAVIQPLGGDAPAYKGQETSMKDPVTGDSMLLSKLESYIHLSPSGAIVISDGTGSEIRLEGGHIILSPAADIRLQPGRDAVFTIPRFLSLFSGDRMELTSDKGEIDVHSAKSLVLSAEGAAVLESRGTRRLESAAYDRRGEGGGVVIRSGTDTHVLGANIRLALQKGADNSTDGVDPVSNGMITLDAGDSPVTVVGSHVSIHGDNGASLSVSSGEGVLVDRGTTYIFSKRLILPINQSIFGGSGTMKWIDPREGRLMSTYFPSPKSLDVAVQGRVDVTDTVNADTLAASEGMFKRLKSFSGKRTESLYVHPTVKGTYQKFIDQYKRWSTRMDDPDIDFGDTNVSNWFSVNSGNPLLTADGVRRLGIYYPMASGYRQTEGFWVSSRWQRMLQETAAKWSPVPVKDADGNDMLPFPGFDGWTERSFMKSWDKDCSPVSTTLSGNWPVNAG